MANIKIPDADGLPKYIASTGAGSDVDPILLRRAVDGMGEVQANPTANTLLARIKSLEDKLADVKTAIEALAVATPDTAAGDLASMSADLDSIDSKLAASTINEYAVTLTVVDTEYSQALPANTKGIEFVSRSGYPVRYAFTTGKVATPTGVYFTLKSNCAYESPATLNLSSKTIYFASDNAGDVVELIAWS